MDKEVIEELDELHADAAPGSVYVDILGRRFVVNHETESQTATPDGQDLIKFGHTALEGTPFDDKHWSVPGEDDMTVAERRKIAGEIEEAMGQITDQESET